MARPTSFARLFQPIVSRSTLAGPSTPRLLLSRATPVQRGTAGPRLYVLGTRWNSSKAPVAQEGEEAVDHERLLDAPAEGSKGQVIGQIEPRLSMTFTCTADECGHRSTHEFAKRSYERGIVIVQCPSCKNRHLIADHLGWFKESTEDGKLRTVEDLLRAKGESIRKGRVGMDGDIEIVD